MRLGMVFLIGAEAMPHVVERADFEEPRAHGESGKHLRLRPAVCPTGSGAQRRELGSELRTFGEGRFARLWGEHKARVGSVERAGLIEGLRLYADRRDPAAEFRKLVGAQEPVPAELLR